MNNLQTMLAAALKEVIEAREARRIAEFERSAQPRRSKADKAEYDRKWDLAREAYQRDCDAEEKAIALLKSLSIDVAA